MDAIFREVNKLADSLPQIAQITERRQNVVSRVVRYFARRVRIIKPSTARAEKHRLAGRCGFRLALLQ